MRTRPCLLALGLLGSASAALVDFNFSYDEIVLKNGRKLEKVAFTTYDTTARKVGIQYLTRNIGAVGRNTKGFEMLIDAPAKGKPKLVDITISRM